MLDVSPQAQPYMQRGAEFYERGELEPALTEFQAALQLQPDLASAKFNIAVILRESERNEEAEQLFRDVIASNEIEAESYNNLGILAVRREDFQEGVEHFRRAIDLKHQFPLAHFNLGTLLLRLGEFEEGWSKYEWRWQTPTFTPIACPQPLWDGSRLDGTLLLHTEQGIGDVFQYARFIPMIRQRCRRLMFLRPDAMDCMFPVERWADDVLSPGEISLDSFQAYLPLMSATHVLGVAAENLPGETNYLTPEPREVPLGASHVADAKLKVGITWGGSPTHVNDAFRSTQLEQLRPLLEVPDVAFYSLQIGERAAEIRDLGRLGMKIRDLGNSQRDFADTAAIVRQLDLVITVDTSLLHLCGGMNLPVWGLISRRSDWRWLGNEREDSPWYPSVRLFRQKSTNDWTELTARVSNALRNLISERE